VGLFWILVRVTRPDPQRPLDRRASTEYPPPASHYLEHPRFYRNIRLCTIVTRLRDCYACRGDGSLMRNNISSRQRAATSRIKEMQTTCLKTVWNPWIVRTDSRREDDSGSQRKTKGPPVFSGLNEWGRRSASCHLRGEYALLVARQVP
jgi:hypothetical protein